MGIDSFFSLFRHLQAEQTKFSVNFIDALDENGKINFGDSPPIAWNEIERWNKTTNEAPHYTLYTGLDLGVYFALFIILTMFQVLTIFLVKKKWSKDFSKISVLDRIIHCFENINIPYTVQEWDTETGNAKEHFMRMKEAQKENLVVIIVNLIYNIVYLVPIFCLGKQEIFLTCIQIQLKQLVTTVTLNANLCTKVVFSTLCLD